MIFSYTYILIYIDTDTLHKYIRINVYAAPHITRPYAVRPPVPPPRQICLILGHSGVPAAVSLLRILGGGGDVYAASEWWCRIC